MIGGFLRRAAASAAIIFAVSTPALAAPTSGVNLTTSPLPINLVAKPGTSTSTDLKIKNNGNQTERLRVTLYKFHAYGEEGKPLIEDLKPQDEYKDWVHFSQTEFDAEPNVWKTIKMTINLPKTAAFGYYYAVAFSRASEAAPDKGTSAISGATAVLVLLEAQSPNAKRQVELVEFTSAHGIYEFLPASFNIKVRNEGNIHVIPTGNIFIKKGSKTVGTASVNAAHGNVLPQSNRIFAAQWDQGFPLFKEKVEDGKAVLDKRGNQQYSLDFSKVDLSKFRFGHYTANLVFVYDNGKSDVPLEATVGFWVIPWRFIGIALVLLAIFGLGIYSAFRGVGRGFRRRG